MTSSPLLSLPGAVPADAPDAGAVAHYGDPYREQRTAERGAVTVDRGHRGVLRVTGPDRLSWLHSLTSQHLEALPPLTPTEALVLSPHGHVEHHLLVVDDGSATWLEVEPGTAPALVTFLDRMRFLLRVEVEDVTASYAVVSVVGPSAPGAVSDALGAAPAAGAGLLLPQGGLARATGWPLPATVDLLLPRATVQATADALAGAGAPAAGVLAYEALRVAARRPRLGMDTDGRTLAQEAGWLGRAVHLDKGCYRGQETVARVHNLGHPPRRLVLLHLDGSGSELPAVGADLTAGGRAVGRVGSVARHHELGPVGLGLLKRTVPDETPLLAGGVAAAVDPAPDSQPVAVGRRESRPELLRLPPR